MKKIWLLFVCLCFTFISGCKKEDVKEPDDGEQIPPHECVAGEWEFPEGTKCLEEAAATLKCLLSPLVKKVILVTLSVIFSCFK